MRSIVGVIFAVAHPQCFEVIGRDQRCRAIRVKIAQLGIDQHGHVLNRFVLDPLEAELAVLIGVVVANEVSQRTLELSFAALALYIAYGLVRRAFSPEP